MTAIRLPLYLNNYGRGHNPVAGLFGGKVGSPGIPMLTNVASAADAPDLWEGPACTTTGPICSDCTDAGDWRDDLPPVRHASAAHIRECWARNREMAAEYEYERRIGA